jgi:MscS family membrane protein
LICQSEMHRPFLLSRERLARLSIGACLLSLGFLVCFPAWAQLGAPASVPAAAQPEVPKDSLGRTTPRGTVFGFLIAARKGDDELAAQYLNTRLRGKAAAVLAHQLSTVLDRRLPPKLNELSDTPEGSLSNLLHPDRDLVGTINSDNGNVDIFLERVDRGKSGSLWLFSGETLQSIPDLYEENNIASLDSILPEFLVNTRFAGIPLFQWLAVFVGMPLFFLLMVLPNRLLSPLIGLLLRRLRGKPDLPNPEFLPKPVRLLLLALTIHWLLSRVAMPLLARQFWSTTTTILTIAGCVWLLILSNRWGEEYVNRRLQSRNITATLMLRLIRRASDLLVIFAGVLVALHHFGVNLTAALAGLGVGGIALALAAQRTLENVIGGISLIFDQTVHVGNSIRVAATQGTVQDIGLRSTRIRTLDRTVVSVPNGQIANMTLENFSSRDKFWFHPILSLGYGTTSSQIQNVLDRIRSLLDQSRYVESDSVRVHFLCFGTSSLDVDIFAYILARDWNHFLELQEALLLRIMECIESVGVQIAFPSQAIFLAAASTSTEAGAEKSFKVPAPGKKTIVDAATKSAQGRRSSL